MQTETLNNSVVVNPKLGSLVEMSFDDDICHPSYYRMELNALDKVTSEDEVRIYITSDGGRLDTGIAVVNRLIKCQAPTTAILEGNCHSCGSIIFLAAQNHEVGISSELLVHAGSGGLGGTPAQQKNRVISYHRQLRELFETVYNGFLSPLELDQLIDDDKEFIFGTEEIKQRLQNMYTYRDGEHTKYHQEMEDMLWEENNKAIDETLSTLDLSEDEIATFNKVRKALDNAAEYEDLSSTPCNEVFTPDGIYEEMVLENGDVDIFYYLDDEGNVELTNFTYIDDTAYPVNSILLSDHRDVVKDVLSYFDVVHNNKANTERLVSKLLTELVSLVEKSLQ